MKRYVEGKPRFIVATVGGQHGYAVVRLDGRLNHSDVHLTPVYDKLHTRQRAERVARRLARQGVSATNTKFHIPLDAKQEEMRARCLEPQPAPSKPEFQRTPIKWEPLVAPRLLTVKQAATYCACAVWAIRQAIWSKELQAATIGRRMVIDKAALDAFIDNRLSATQ